MDATHEDEVLQKQVQVRALHDKALSKYGWKLGKVGVNTEYQRLLLRVNQAKTRQQGRRALRAYSDYLKEESVFTKLLREAQEDEETFVWYAEQDFKTKGYQWHQSSQVKYVRLVAYALGALFGFTVEEVTRQMDECGGFEDQTKVKK